MLPLTDGEVRELTWQLHKARQHIFGLVKMRAEMVKERDQLRVELN
ncbi:hypothetical protein [Pseudomonas sp. SJZ131]|nr:hypothetical protein [Pseudomonas sp. SJZ131]